MSTTAADAERIGVAVLGAGNMGLTHIDALSSIPGARVVVVADASIAVAEKGKALAHADRATTNPCDAIEDPEVEGVVIALPDEAHEEFVLACLEARKPVLCEKPLAPDADACHRITIREAALGRRLVQLGFMRRLDPAYAAMKAALDDRVAGAPLLLHFAHRSPGPSTNRTFEAMIENAAVHEIDAARWLTGEEIVNAKVYLPPAAARPPASRLGPLVIIMTTASGMPIDAEIFVNAGYGYDIRAELVCEAGTFTLAPRGLLRLSLAGQDSSPVPQNPQTRFRKAYRRQMQAWVDSATSGRVICANAWDGYAATCVADACLDSLKTGEAADVVMETRPDFYS